MNVLDSHYFQIMNKTTLLMRNYLPKMLIGSSNRNFECEILKRNRSIHLGKY